jgi:hypothetical protein
LQVHDRSWPHQLAPTQLPIMLWISGFLTSVWHCSGFTITLRHLVGIQNK